MPLPPEPGPTDATAGAAHPAEAVPGLETPLAAAAEARAAATLGIVRRALAERTALLAFQPVVSARDPSRIAFWEGLIRLCDPAGRVLPARDFMAEAETSELGRMIDALALEMGLAQLAVHPGLRLSVNMSARSIGYARWLRALETGLAAGPDIGARLILEITEGSAMLMPDIVSAFMKDLQGRGITFALDDFGAGFTSFRHLREFTFDIVKIDGQFIRGIAANPDNQVVTAAILSVARQFDMFTVAESVEEAADAALLARLGVDCLQGFLYGAPTLRPPWREEAARARA